MKKIGMFCFLCFVNIENATSQCSSSGPFFGTSFSNDASIGNISWSNTSNAGASDGSKTSASALIIGDVSNYLVVKGFGFNITSPANICGIEVEIERSASGLLQIVKDNSIRIIKEGVITGANKAGLANWPGSDALTSYGSNSDLWGETWLVSDINSGEFGVAISTNLTSLSALPSAHIDGVRVTVYYISTLPIQVVSFNAHRLNEQRVQLEWETKTEINRDYFSIERSADAYNWEEIGRLNSAGNSSNNRYYKFMDGNVSNEMIYYRLRQMDVDGRSELSDMVVVLPGVNLNEVVQLSPNPCTNALNIKINSTIKNTGIEAVVFEAESGKIVQRHELFSNKGNTINTSDLDPGIYFISINDGHGIDKKVKFIKSN